MQDSIIQSDFSSGMIRDVAPHLIDERGAYDLLNTLLNEDGSPYRRGGTQYLSDADHDSDTTFLWSGFTHVGQRILYASSSNFAVVDSDGESPVDLGGDGMPYPKPAAYLAGLLFIGGGYIYGGSRKAASYSTGTVTVSASTTVTGSGTSWSSNLDAGMLFQIGNERVYVIESVDSDTQITLRDAYEGSAGSGKSYNAHNIYKITSSDPYPVCSHYAVIQNRLCWCDGDKFRFTDTTLNGGPHSYTADEDYHEMPDGVKVIGLAEAGASGLLFTTAGVFTVQGLAYDIVDTAGNVQHRLDRLSEDLILWGDASLAFWEQMVIAPCLNGVYLLDGISSPVKLSQNVDPLYTHYTDRDYRPGGSAVYKGHYFLPITDDDALVSDFLVCRLDRKALDRRRRAGFPWTRFDGHGGTLIALSTKVDQDPRDPQLLGADVGGRVVDCSAFFEPAAAVKNDADGSTHEWRIITRDYYVDPVARASFRKLRVLYEMTDASSDNPTLLAEWSDGLRVEGVIQWGEFNWNAESWYDADTAEFVLLRDPDGAPYEAPEDGGTNPFKYRINKTRRRIRFRIRTSDPTATLTLRVVEIFFRPPGSRRR